MVDYRERLEAAVAALIDDNIVRFDEITSDIMRDKTTEKVLEVRDGMAQSLFNFADPENDDYEEAVEEETIEEENLDEISANLAMRYRNAAFSDAYPVATSKSGKPLENISRGGLATKRPKTPEEKHLVKKRETGMALADKKIGIYAKGAKIPATGSRNAAAPEAQDKKHPQRFGSFRKPGE